MILETKLKKSLLALSALTLAVGLSACGGGTSTHTVGGSVAGLEYPGLILSNNGETLPIAPPGTDATTKAPKVVTYSFSKRLDYGERYNVKVEQLPEHQKCDLQRETTPPSEIAGRLATINVMYVCSLASHTIGGTVSGLTADGLVLTNGSTGGKIPVAKDATTFTFTDFPVTYNQTYGVTVLEHPANMTCTVANGAGTMKDENITSIVVTCRANQPS